MGGYYLRGHLVFDRRAKLHGGTIRQSQAKGSKVWLFNGLLDSVVVPGVTSKTMEYYSGYTASSNIRTILNVSAQHAWVTNFHGSSCE